MTKTMFSPIISTVYAIILSVAVATGAHGQITLPSIGEAPARSANQANNQRPTVEEIIARSGVPAESVAAVVNETVITTYDVRQRMKLMIMGARGQIPDEVFGQLQQQALRDLIEDELKIQETVQFEMEASDADLQQEYGLIAAQSNLSPTQLSDALAASGVSPDSLKRQLTANMLWPELVQGRFRDRIRVNDSEIENTLDRMREDAQREQYLVSEICIPVADPAQAQRYYQGGLQLIEQMRRGVPFSVVAQQFSACTTAAVGGDLGWVRSGELPAELDTAVSALEKGSVTNPIPSDGAFIILALRDKRDAAVQGQPTFTLAHAVADRSIGENAARIALERLESADPCNGSGLRIDLGAGVGVTRLENLTLEQIQEPFRNFIEDLDRGDLSPIIEADGAYHTALVCDKDDGLGLPSRSALEQRIFTRQLNRISQQYLRDVERKSMVDIRLKEPVQPAG